MWQGMGTVKLFFKLEWQRPDEIWKGVRQKLTQFKEFWEYQCAKPCHTRVLGDVRQKLTKAKNVAPL